VEQTLRRAAMLVAPGHVLAAVVHAHERFYAPLLDDVPATSVLIQPEDRGSATAVFSACSASPVMRPSPSFHPTTMSPTTARSWRT
jgi:hypothetical protein